MTGGRVERVKLRAVLRHAGYRRLWAARTVSQWGDAFATVALGLLVFQRTGTGLGVAGVAAAEIVPVMLLAPVAGVVVDRVAPLRVMVAADVVRAVLAALLPLVASSVPAIFVIAAGMAAAGAFFNPSATTALPALVSENELVAANSGIWMAAVLSQIVIAPVAGVVVAGAGFGWAFGVNAASFAASGVLLAGLRLPHSARWQPRSSWTREARDGLAAVTTDPLLRALAAGQLLAALSAGATSALLVVLARESLGLDPRGYGLMLGAIGVGAALGPLLLFRFVADPRRAPFVFGPFLLRSAVDVILAVTRVPEIALAALAGYGVGTSTGAVTFTSLLQAETPAKTRGRVFAAFDVIWQTGRLASLIGGGVLADRLGIDAVYLAGGVLLVAAAVVGHIGLRARSRAGQ